jgi:hypothetical protein
MQHQYMQEFATPGEAMLAHHGVKGQKWGVRTSLSLDNARATVNTKTANATASVRGAASRTSGAVNSRVVGAKTGAQNAVNAKVAGVKQNAQNRADAKLASAKQKKDTVANNNTVHQVTHEVKGAAWGTRQAYIEKTLNDAERLNNIAAGKAGIDSKVLAAKDLVLTKKQAKIMAPIFERHAQRVKAGQLKTADILLMSARLRRRDLTIGVDIAGKRNKASKKRGAKEANFDNIKKLRVGI